jgi:predicted Zn-dependent peptidase
MGPAFATVTAQLRDLAERGPSSTEVARAKALLTARYRHETERTPDLAATLAALYASDRDPSSLADDVDAIQKVRAADIRDAARVYLDPAQLVSVVAGPALTVSRSLKGAGVHHDVIELPDPL